MLQGFLNEVTKPMVGILLLERDPGVLDNTYGDHDESVFEAYVAQVGSEVIAVTGPEPSGARRSLAVQCTAYGVASSVEYAEFPEQQAAGSTGRGWFLKQKFGELLDMLRGMRDEGGRGTSGGTSRATFPPAKRYPDPFRFGAR